jgi:hypothetical protein
VNGFRTVDAYDSPSTILRAMTQNIDARIDRLLKEAESIKGLNYQHPTFQAWRKRAETAVDEKLGATHRVAKELAELDFHDDPGVWFEGMTPPSEADHRSVFDNDLATAKGILLAAREASPKSSPKGGRGPIVNVHQEGATATANAAAQVSVHVSADQLRTVIATSPDLTSEEKGAAIAAVPDDTDSLDVEKLDRLLSVATKSKDLLKTVLGWVLANAERWPF